MCMSDCACLYIYMRVRVYILRILLFMRAYRVSVRACTAIRVCLLLRVPVCVCEYMCVCKWVRNVCVLLYICVLRDFELSAPD